MTSNVRIEGKVARIELLCLVFYILLIVSSVLWGFRKYDWPGGVDGFIGVVFILPLLVYAIGIPVTIIYRGPYYASMFTSGPLSR